MLIYVPKITPRVRYTFRTIFRTYLGLEEYSLTTGIEEFNDYKGAKFSYGSKPLRDELHFTASGLLQESGIKEQTIPTGELGGVVILFANRNKYLPFDAFAASFYMLSRYEEYLPHLRDQYDRFPSRESLAKEKGFLQKAVVDRWVMLLKEVLQNAFQDLHFPTKKYSYLPTLDIDNAYAYKHKGLLRTVASVGKNLLTLNFQVLSSQIKVLLGKRNDPFDTYNYQLNIQKKYNIKPLYFILIGDYGLNDKNLNHENKSFQQLIKSISDYARLGVHPSFGSNSRPERLKVEIIRLQQIIKSEIKRSRQHFLKLSLPETYRNLMEADIEEDYTMGFADELGFRAGTCTPYPFYDLDEEVECKLTVFPFQLMEATLKYYMKLSPDESITVIKQIIDEVKMVNGTFISLWHNESLSDEMEWKGWRNVYEEMIQYALPKKQ